MTTPTNSALHMMEGQGLSDEQIVAIATKAHAEGRLLWIGFEKDEDGRYTIPTLSGSDFQLVRAVLEAVPPRPPSTTLQTKWKLLERRRSMRHEIKRFRATAGCSTAKDVAWSALRTTTPHRA